MSSGPSGGTPVPASRPAPIVLLTDFGLDDWYVAAMKGVLLSRAPDAALVDLTHGIPPGEVRRAAFVLGEAWPSFPEGTVFLAVVDPGVGGGRRPLAVRAAGRHFVGPDNGVLTPALERTDARAFVLDPRRLGPGALSATFHGRDLFAPAAARLALGADPAALGEPSPDPLRLPPERPTRDADGLRGRIRHVDRFGNCISDLRREDLEEHLAGRSPAGLVVRAGGIEIAGLSRTYADVPEGELLALVGSGGRLEISARGASAAGRLGLGPGSEVEVVWRAGRG